MSVCCCDTHKGSPRRWSFHRRRPKLRLLHRGCLVTRSCCDMPCVHKRMLLYFTAPIKGTRFCSFFFSYYCMTIAVPDYHTSCNIVSFSDNIVTMVSLKMGMDLQIVNWAYVFVVHDVFRPFTLHVVKGVSWACCLKGILSKQHTI